MEERNKSERKMIKRENKEIFGEKKLTRKDRRIREEERISIVPKIGEDLGREEKVEVIEKRKREKERFRKENEREEK